MTYHTNPKNIEFFFKNLLTNGGLWCIIDTVVRDETKTKRPSQSKYGGLAQLGEHLPYKQRVTGSSPVVPISQRVRRIFLRTTFLTRPGSSVG